MKTLFFYIMKFDQITKMDIFVLVLVRKKAPRSNNFIGFVFNSYFSILYFDKLLSPGRKSS